MGRKAMVQKLVKMGKARGLLEGVLNELKAGNVRAHHFEYKMKKVIEDLEQLAIEFTETF